MALAFRLLFVTLHLAAMRNEILRRRVRTLRLLQAHGARAWSFRPHAAFIVAAYVAAVLVVVALIAWVIADYRAQQRVLAELEARGLGRKPGNAG